MSKPGWKNCPCQIGTAVFGIFIPLCAFGWLAHAVSCQPSLAWEDAILRCFPASTTPALDWIIGLAALSGEINVVVVLAVLGVVVMKRLKRMREALFLTLTIVGVVILELVFRAFVQRKLLAWAGSSTPTFDFGFPASQAADTFAIVSVFVILAWSTRWRWPVIAGGIVYVLAVAVSRLYLGLHYPSDILAGWALGLICVTAASFARHIPMKFSHC